MRKTIYRFIIAAAAIALSASCTEKRMAVAFGVDTSSIEALAEGGKFSVSLASESAWTAVTDNPWISVSPANGPASASCSISIDSTVVSGARDGIVRFKNRVSGESHDIRVHQDGYGYNIQVLSDDINVNHYANVEKRVFDVKVRTNVPFDVVIPSSASRWLSCEVPQMSLDHGARPREFTVRFSWGINSVNLERIADVEFQPASGYTAETTGHLKVVQTAAPEIEIGHAGDSIVVLSLSRNLGMINQMVAAEPMANWDNVLLWEPGDKGYTPEKKGRVKAAAFTLFQTTEEIPYEVQYLTEAEELYFFSNINSFLYKLDIGEHLCKLENLKRLTVSAYGLTDLTDSMKKLKNLEWLDLSANNFSELPQVLTPENFPKLHALMLNTCQRGYVLDLSNTVAEELGGFMGEFPRRLLEWEQLDTLRLSVNYFEGIMPDMEDYPVKYTEQDCTDLNLPPALVGTPKVLPNAKYFAFNLNRLYGELPDWVLYHPNLTMWNPYSLCYPQEGRARNGVLAGFSNIPVNMDYYWSFYDGYKEHEDIYLGD